LTLSGAVLEVNDISDEETAQLLENFCKAYYADINKP